MQKSIEKILVDIITHELDLPETYGKTERGNVIPCVVIYSQNIKLFNTNKLQICVRTVDDKGGTENNIKYDMEFLNGVFLHLALVNNPRYERANIVFNSKTVISNFNPHHGKDGKFCSGNNASVQVNPNYKKELKEVIDKAKNHPNERQKLVIGKVTDDLIKKAKNKGFNLEGFNHDLDVSGVRHAYKEHGDPKREEPRGQIAITDEDFEKIPEIIYKYDVINFEGKNNTGLETISYTKKFKDGTFYYLEEIRNGQKTLTINSLRKHKNTGNPRTSVDNNDPLSNTSIYIIPYSDTDFNPDVTEGEVINGLKLIINNCKPTIKDLPLLRGLVKILEGE